MKKNRFNRNSGQSLIEYALILFLVAIAFGIALAATAPAISNVFSNTVYNLLGQAPDENREVVGPMDFWLTVTWVAANPLEERPLPTRTQAPPSPIPTAGPSPTPSPTVPTNTPFPSNTPAPSPTSLDYVHVAPFHDSADEPDWYRMGAPIFMGYNDWQAEFYTGKDLDYNGVSPSAVMSVGEHFGPAAEMKLDFPNSEYNWWKNSGSYVMANWPSSSSDENYSIRFTRQVYLDLSEPTPITFFISADDGVRLWLLSPGQSADNCSATGTVSGGPSSGSNRFYGDDSSYPTDCLLIDDWQNQGMNSTGAVTRTVTAGAYTIQVDFYQGGGGSGLFFSATGSANPDDRVINMSDSATSFGDFTVTTNRSQCNWGQQTGNNVNTYDYMWEEYVGGNPIDQTMCYLELRGSVLIPDASDVANPAIPDPKFIFWDVWDFSESDKRAWLEIAEYVPVGATPTALDRASVIWYRVPLHAGNTRNYNWTRHEIDLANFQAFNSDWTPMAAPVDFRGKRVIFRFAIAQGDYGTRRWYIDDIEIRGNTPAENMVIGLDQTFTLNEADAADMFITTGQWELTANNVMPDRDNPDTNPSSCCSWELNPGSNYNDFSQSPWNPRPNLSTPMNSDDWRVHYVQIAPLIDTTLSTVDEEGDNGAPLLSFWHGYDIKRYAGIQIEYRPEGDTQWYVVPGVDPNNPYGRIIDPRHNDNSSYNDKTALSFYEVPLSEIKTPGGVPITRYHLRFAMYVHNRADTERGWWIDDIKLERAGIPRYLDYPFYDGAEAGMSNWLAGGEWWRTNRISREGQHAFTDSPGEGVDYQRNTGDALSGNNLRLRYPIDLNNDTPANLALNDRNASGGNTQSTPALNPVLTFWHIRDLNSNDNFHVEWRLANEGDDQWKPLWSYIYRMETDPGSSNSEFSTNLAWEYVEIDLTPITSTFPRPGDPGYDPSQYERDDILLRFRLYSDGYNTADGVYIDQIRLEDRNETVFKLWRAADNPTIDGNNYGNGDSDRFTSDLEESDWTDNWRVGGDWQRITFESYNGLHAFHESAEPVVPGVFSAEVAPYVHEDDDGDSNDTNIKTRHDTFNVLELVPIFDLRAADSKERQTLYFWSRFRTGDNDELMVQISYELSRPSDYAPQSNLNSHMTARCDNIGVLQCYEQLYGWSEWETATVIADEWDYVHTWNRYQVDLSQYAADFDNDIPGRRIRIRFVFDALSGSNNRDGWYLDNIEIRQRRDNVIRVIDQQPFFDDARNMGNWVGEGLWGLSPAVTRGSSNELATLGSWQESFWDCDQCESIGSNAGASWRDRMAVGADIFLQNDGVIPAQGVNETPVQRLVLDINYDMGRGFPYSGFNERDTFVGRWTLTTAPIGPSSGINAGQYTFITRSDDGVRMKYEIVDGAGNVIDPLAPPSNPWNVINNWNDHGAVTDMGVVTLLEGNRYRITLEYYERSSDAIITLATAGAEFSFTDSPRQGVGPAFDDIPAVPRGNSSLILDGTLDLTGTTNPIMEYYSVWELPSGSYATVEVSADGGFNWTRNGLRDTIYASDGTTVLDNDFDSTRWNNSERDPGDTWDLRRANLTRYENRQIMIRFRLDRMGTDCLNRDWGCNPSSDPKGPNGWYASWWIVDIQVAGS